MGIAKKIIGATKHDVELAKIELKSKKMDRSDERRRLIQEGLQAKKEFKENRIQEQKKKAEVSMEEKMTSVERLNSYTISNIDALRQQVEKTIGDYYSVRTELDPLEEAYTARHNRRGLVFDNQKADLEYYNLRNRCLDKLRYIYLIKDYFECLGNYVCGISLTKTQAELIDTVSRFLINGTPILKCGFDEDVSDDSLLGAFRELKSETLGMIGVGKFSALAYVDNHYGSELHAYIVPDVDSSLNKYINACDALNVSNNCSKSDDLNEIECPNCKKKLAPDSRFCSQCGTKVELPKPFFCSQCGMPAQPGSRFCSSCGNKF